MLNVYQNQTNEFSISSLYPKTVIPNPYYIFKWVDYNYREVIISLADQSPYPDRYSLFYATDSSDFTIRASGEYTIYESAVDASVIDASMNLLTNGLYTYVPVASQDIEYDPSLFSYNGIDVVFNPIFGSSDVPSTNVSHDDLLERNLPDNHPQYVKNASLGDQFHYENGILLVDASSSGGKNYDASIGDLWSYNSIQDASILALEASIGTSMDYAYVDGSLATRDIYALDLSTRIDAIPTGQDASIADLYNEIENIPQDASIANLYSTKQDNIVDGTFLKESSIGYGLEWNAGLLDVSIEIPVISQDASILSLYEITETLDSSIAALFAVPQDASIADLYNEIENIPQDASISDLYFEISDVSAGIIKTLIGLQDVSIVDLSTNNILQFDPSGNFPGVWKNQPPADATQWFYTKAEIDAFLAAIVGGTYP